MKRIYSKRKKQEVEAILRDFNPRHAQRLWLVGFLKFCGYGEREILNLIRLKNKWGDYNSEITEYQTLSIFGGHATPFSQKIEKVKREDDGEKNKGVGVKNE